MRTTSTPEAFTIFANQHEPEYLEANYKELVREFSIKENDELKRKVKPPMILFEGKNVIVPYYPLCQYKAMAQEAINKPLANKQGVINTLLDVYINKPLKETKTDVSQVYNNLRNGANHFLTGNKFLYFSNLIAIEELIKFEMYLLEGCKENAKRAGRKPVKQLSAEQYLLVSDDDKQIFLDKLKIGFKDSEKKDFCYFLIGLDQLNLLNTTNQQNIFNSFSQYFGGDNGTYPNFHNHWKNPNDEKLLQSTKTEIMRIKNMNVIT